jgi:peptide-methionine (S)-S-oxide reductase
MARFTHYLIATIAGFSSAGLAFLSSAGAEKPIQSDAPTRLATAVFAGGCFWCVESDFDKLEGVIETTSGYTGGQTLNPTYQQVSREETGHYEAVRVTYDPAVVSYAQLTDYFIRHVDPTDAEGQFCDKGDSYRTAIFVARDGERTAAETTTNAAGKILAAPIATQILAASTFWPAETYHQDYYTKNPVRYKYYRTACGRDAAIKALWGKKKSS